MQDRKPRLAGPLLVEPRLVGKVAIVTGAGSSGPGVGTGKATSICFAREGAKVLLVDRITQRAGETLDSIVAEGGEASVFEADITLADDCQGMVEAAVERYGAIHVLFNNVGILLGGGVTEVQEKEWDSVLDVNLKSMMLTSKYAIPQMVRSGGGSIINVSSIAALRGSNTDSIAYYASKGGVISMTTAMAVKHGRDNIRVNCILPGLIYTPMVAGQLTEDTRDLNRRAAPLGTEGTAWDVAWAAAFLASDQARWITGVSLPVDGGILAASPMAMEPYLAGDKLLDKELAPK